MNRTDYAITVMMLDMAIDEFDNHGCNDYWLANTPENLDFVRRMIASSDFPDDEPEVVEDKILMLDWDIMSFCKRLLLDEARKLERPQERVGCLFNELPGLEANHLPNLPPGQDLAEAGIRTILLEGIAAAFGVPPELLEDEEESEDGRE